MLKWFELNEMKPNADKCHLIICNENEKSVSLENNIIESEKSVELLGITINNDLKFSDHITKLCTEPIKNYMAYPEFQNS